MASNVDIITNYGEVLDVHNSVSNTNSETEQTLTIKQAKKKKDTSNSQEMERTNIVVNVDSLIEYDTSTVYDFLLEEINKEITRNKHIFVPDRTNYLPEVSSKYKNHYTTWHNLGDCIEKLIPVDEIIFEDIGKKYKNYVKTQESENIKSLEDFTKEEKETNSEEYNRIIRTMVDKKCQDILLFLKKELVNENISINAGRELIIRGNYEKKMTSLYINFVNKYSRCTVCKSIKTIIIVNYSHGIDHMICKNCKSEKPVPKIK